MIVVQIGFIWGTTFFVKAYIHAIGKNASSYEKEMATTYLVEAIIFGAFGLFFLIMIYVGYKHLKTAIDVLDASADFLAKTKRIFLVPTFNMVIQIIFVALFMYSMLAIT